MNKVLGFKLIAAALVLLAVAAWPLTANGSVATQEVWDDCETEEDCREMADGIMTHLLDEGTDPDDAGYAAGAAYQFCLLVWC